MFRENVLNHPDVIDRLARRMVPIAVNYETVQDSLSPESQFLRPLMKQRPERRDEQGVWIFSPQGQVLGGFVGFGDMLGRTKEEIDRALEAGANTKLAEREVEVVHPFRGKDVRQDGSVSLAEYVRRRDRGPHLHTTSPVISTITLSAKELRALAPPEPVVGTKWSLPGPVAKRFCRLTSPMCYQHAPQPDWVSGAHLEAKVRSIRDGQARVRYEGTLISVHRSGIGKKISEQKVALEGEGIYDVKAQQMRALMFVGSGTLKWPEAPDAIVTFDALAEWTLEGAPQP